MSELSPVSNFHHAPGRELETPHTAAQKEWDRYVGDVMMREKRWRKAAAAGAVITGLSVLGLIYLGSKPRVVPYVVRVDKVGSPSYGGVLAAESGPIKVTSSEIKAHVLRWLEDVRSVSTDAAIVKKNWFEAYAVSTDVARNQLTLFAKEHVQTHREAEERVTVELQAIVQSGQERWQADWREITWDKNGALVESAQWRASIHVIQRPAQNLDEVEPNPLGLLINEFSWTRVQN